MVESFSISRVGALGMSMAQNLSCRISVDSQSLSRTTFGWPEGHDLGSSKGDGICSTSQESLGEMNGDMNFASLNGSWLGRCSAIGISRCVAEAIFPNSSLRLPWGYFLE